MHPSAYRAEGNDSLSATIARSITSIQDINCSLFLTYRSETRLFTDI